MRLTLLLLSLAASPLTPVTPSPKQADAPVPGPPLLPKLKLKQHAEENTTRCVSCHTTSTWSEVRFNHEKTGFPLKGKHARVDCRGCHAASFDTPVPRQCAACHRDAHTQDLGAHCESCHDETTWRSPFNADAHRRTNFPLVGAHAVIPCQECHAEVRDRRFARPTVTCSSCHQGDLTRTLGTAIDHAALGFTQDCQQCHGAFAFRPARFPNHDSCFLVSYGSHAAFSCAQCHTTLQVMTAPGTCSTRTAACTQCHEHTCTVTGGQTPTDQLHQGVAGYQCANRKCYECHQTGAR